MLLHFYISIHIHHECTVSSKSSTPLIVLRWRRVYRASLQLLLVATLCAKLKIDTGDHGNNKKCSQSRDTCIFADHVINHLFHTTMPRLCKTIHFTAKCSLSLQVVLLTAFTFSVYKKKQTYLLTICQLSKKRDKIAINGRGFQDYRLQYKNVVQVVAHEACRCLCCPAQP